MLTLPDEIIEYIFKSLDIKSLITLTLTCERFYNLNRSLNLWKFFVNRDWSFQYEKYLKDINEKNLKNQQAIEALPYIQNNIQLIEKARDNLLICLRNLINTPHSSKGMKFMINDHINGIAEDLDGIDDLKPMILQDYHHDVLPRL